MCSPFCRKNVMAGIFAMGWRAGRYLARNHTGSIGKKGANSFGNRFFCVHGTKKKYIVRIL
jgi:hypothetical protein